MSAGAFPTVRVAAIQATPVVLDAVASIDKALSLLHQAAQDGARLAVFPEAFIALYPSYAWARIMDDAGLDTLWVRLWEACVDVPGPLMTDSSMPAASLTCTASSGERAGV
jgi:nitrilase